MGEWLTPKRKKKDSFHWRETNNVASDNPFSPLMARSAEGSDQQKVERPPYIYNKNVTNINALKSETCGN